MFMRVRDWMTEDPITVEPKTSVRAAWKVMHERHIRHLPVLEERKLVGIVTERDLRSVQPSPATSLEIHELHYLLDKLTVGEVMTKDVITTTPATKIVDVARTLLRNRIGALPVMVSGALVGIVTDTDVLEAFTATAEGAAVRQAA